MMTPSGFPSIPDALPVRRHRAANIHARVSVLSEPCGSGVRSARIAAHRRSPSTATVFPGRNRRSTPERRLAAGTVKIVVRIAARDHAGGAERRSRSSDRSLDRISGWMPRIVSARSRAECTGMGGRKVVRDATGCSCGSSSGAIPAREFSAARLQSTLLRSTPLRTIPLRTIPLRTTPRAGRPPTRHQVRSQPFPQGCSSASGAGGGNTRRDPRTGVSHTPIGHFFASERSQWSLIGRLRYRSSFFGSRADFFRRRCRARSRTDPMPAVPGSCARSPGGVHAQKRWNRRTGRERRADPVTGWERGISARAPPAGDVTSRGSGGFAVPPAGPLGPRRTAARAW